MSTVFQFSGLLVLPFWALMILRPRWRGTARIMRSLWVIAAPAALYVLLVIPRVAEVWSAVAHPTLRGVAGLLGSPAGATIAWVHFLAFDLFVGRWIYLDSQERQVSAGLMAPVLFLTLMLGPAGFLLYLAVRSVASRCFSRRGEAASSNLPPEAPNRMPLVRSVQSASFSLLNRAFEINRPLTLLGVAMLFVLLATLIGLIVDHRVITGAPAWLKPAKFALSISIYCFTFVWLLGFVEGHPRLVRLIVHVTAVSFIAEMIAIVTQAGRGTTSHFNVSTPLDRFIWSAMGAFIIFVWAMNLLLAILLIRQRMPDRVFAWSLRLGVLISSVGMATAFLMTGPTPEQRRAIEANHAPRIVGAHSVGMADGGPGLPIVGWSTAAGDLRVAHFVGIHALQVLPFLGWLLTQRRRVLARLGESHRLALVWIGGLAYLGVVGLLVWQALRGQPVIHPDARTVAVAVALASAAVTAISATVAQALRANRKARELAPPAGATGIEHALPARGPIANGQRTNEMDFV